MMHNFPVNTVSFFFCWVAKTQLNHWTECVVSIELIAQNPTNCPNIGGGVMFPIRGRLGQTSLSLAGPVAHPDDNDCFYYHPWRNNVAIAFGTLSSFLS